MQPISRKNRVTATLATIFAIAMLTIPALAQTKVSENFSQTYPLSANGEFRLSNINGKVTIVGWDRNEVKVDAVKWAYTQERLSEAKIMVENTPNRVTVHTEYPDRNMNWSDNDYRNPATVDYTISIPRNARIDGVSLVNGDLNISGVSGSVRANSVNGRVEAVDLKGDLKLSTVNNTVKVRLDQVGRESDVELSSVNGRVEVTLPSDTNASLEASVVHGDIDTDFGMAVNSGWVGRNIRSEIGNGEGNVHLSNVNGSIKILRANDNKQQSPVKDLGESARRSSRRKML